MKAQVLEIGLFIYRQQDEVVQRNFAMGKINISRSFKLAPLYTDCPPCQSVFSWRFYRFGAGVSSALPGAYCPALAAGAAFMAAR